MANISVMKRSEPTEVSAKFVIEDFVREMKAAKPGECFKSNPFQAGANNAFRVVVYPNGCSEETKSHVGVYIENTMDTALEAKISLRAVGISGKISTVLKGKTGIRWDQFVTHADCEEACKQGRRFEVKVKLELPGKIKITEVRTASDTGKKKREYSVLENIYRKKLDTDFVIMCDGSPVPCHKLILAGASPVFEAMLSNKMNKEVIEGRLDLEIPLEIGKAFVESIYTGRLSGNILKNEANTFLQLGDKYQMGGLKDLAEEEMINQLDRENMVKLLAIGDMFRAQELRAAALKFTKANLAWLRSQKPRMTEVRALSMDLVMELL